MNQDRLRALLVELDRELKSTGSLDARSKDLLEQVLADVRELDTPAAPGQNQSVEDRLRKLVLQFESEHPRLSGAVAQVADALAKLGI